MNRVGIRGRLCCAKVFSRPEAHHPRNASFAEAASGLDISMMAQIDEVSSSPPLQTFCIQVA